jgi:hypothetical protein
VSRFAFLLGILPPMAIILGVLVLVGRAITHSWLWGAVAALAVIGAYVALVVRLGQWSRSHTGAAQSQLEQLSRALAFHSGGWEGRRAKPAVNDPNPPEAHRDPGPESGP